jgi:hypothetical protein
LNVLVTINGRQAIPVRAIPFVTDWSVTPHMLVTVYSGAHHELFAIPENHFVYRQSPDGSYLRVRAAEWDMALACIASIQGKSDAAIYQDEIRYLPGNAFVWRDELEHIVAFHFDPEFDGPEWWDKREGDSELNFDPYIPPDLVLLVFDGFSPKSEPEPEPEPTKDKGPTEKAADYRKNVLKYGNEYISIKVKAGSKKPGLSDISKHLEGLLSEKKIPGPRGVYLDAATIRRRYLVGSGITGRKPNGRK